MDLHYLVRQIKNDPECKHNRRGFLYFILKKVLCILSDPKLSDDEVLLLHEKICKAYNIRESSKLDEDYQFSVKFIDELVMNYLTVRFIIPPKEIMLWNPVINIEDKTTLIIVAAIFIVALFQSRLIIKRLTISDNSQRRSQPQSRDQGSTNLSEVKKTIPTSICLTLYAKDVANLTVGKILTVDEVKQYISRASYYQVVKLEIVQQLEQKLHFALDKLILKDSTNDTYLRIDISDGKEIIGKTSKFGISENLNPTSRYIVGALVCLDNLRGLEDFIRA